jgi:hypothetical protein
VFKKTWSRLLLAFIVSIYSIAAVYAIAPIENDGTATIVAGANTLTMGTGQWSHVLVWLSSGSTPINITFNMNATASASNALLASGASISYGLGGNPGSYTNQINYFSGASPTGTISWMAW